MNRKIFILLILLPILIAAQTEQKKDVWEPHRKRRECPRGDRGKIGVQGYKRK